MKIFSDGVCNQRHLETLLEGKEVAHRGRKLLQGGDRPMPCG